MIVICMDALKMIGGRRLDRSEECRLAHNLLKIDRGTVAIPRLVSGGFRY
jgi:hypothetical protein